MKKLNIVSIGLTNLKRQGGRTMVMIIFSFILSASLLASGIIKESMHQSVEKTVNRMGADVIVVPKEYATNYSDALFSGEQCSFYFDKSWYSQVEHIEGIEQASPQLYLASLSADCCSEPIQLIAFEPETDFIVQPWMKKLGIQKLNDDEVIIGNAMSAEVGDLYKFFGKNVKVAGKLERTGTGYDHCAFMNFHTAQSLMQTEQAKNNGLADVNPQSAISTIMIRVDKDTSASRVSNSINYGLGDSSPIKAYTANGIVSSVADSVASFSAFTKVLNYLLLVMAVLAIVCIFTITIVQRKTEFGVMITLGASKQKLIGILVTEGLVVSLDGGILGMLASGGMVWAFRDVILTKLEIPELTSSIVFYARTAVECLGVSMVAGLLASICAIVAITKGEPLRLIEEVNA